MSKDAVVLETGAAEEVESDEDFDFEEPEAETKAKKPKKRGRKKTGVGIGATATAALLDTETYAYGATNEEALEAVMAAFPDASTSLASITWYRNKLRKDKTMRLDGGPVLTARELKAARAGDSDGESTKVKKVRKKAESEQEDMEVLEETAGEELEDDLFGEDDD